MERVKPSDGGRLAGKIAIVVGAGQAPGEGLGNGRATAMRFAEEGAEVLLVDRNLKSAEETLDLIERSGGKGSALEADISVEDDCRAIAEACLKTYGRIDVLHNNVGIGHVADQDAVSMDEEIWERIFRVNTKGIMLVCKHVLPAMIEARSGVITNISSIAAICTPPQLFAYKSSKAALNAFTQAMALKYASKNIRANVIMPGLIETPMATEQHVSGEERQKRNEMRNKAVPLGRQMGNAWDIANASLFLASDEARFITGVLLPVDGGQSARTG